MSRPEKGQRLKSTWETKYVPPFNTLKRQKHSHFLSKPNSSWKGIATCREYRLGRSEELLGVSQPSTHWALYVTRLGWRK